MSELDIKNISNSIINSEKYSYMIENIKSSISKTIIDSESFNKSSSQLKTATLDITDLTPINSARHLLASISNTRMALEKAEVELKRKKIEYRKKLKEIEKATGLDKELLEVDLQEIQYDVNNVESSGRAAIRKLNNLINQYKSILSSLGIESISEEMYEQDQIKYHIMTAFYQALTAARARGGIIDEGNHIYLFQLGINGSVAQAEVSSLLNAEGELLSKGKAPSHRMVLSWLEECARKYHEDVIEYIEYRNFKQIDAQSLVELVE